MPRPGSHASRDWPLIQAALVAEAGLSLPPHARRLLGRVHHHIDRRQRGEEQHLHFMRRAPDQSGTPAATRGTATSAR
ncbi:MAG: hypothetical protein LC624_07590 [Halobacteriales archaeon]|nr:hypothetical protein [Halobacteriales archaeon]